MLWLREEKIIDQDNVIGSNIKRLRLEKGIGQTELVKQLQLENVDITRETLVKIEGGRQHIKLEQLRGIRNILKVSYEVLLNDYK
ncbi:helix-turn-helix domain-containing protein [Enterococcus sp. LJL98]